MRVAILGTGKMGGAIARRLNSEGHDLSLWNRTRQRAVALGMGEVAATPAEAVDNAEVVISILTDAGAIRAAYLGQSGAVEAARDQVFVEMSTAGPDVAAEIAPHVERNGSRLIAAPVLGSVPTVETGKLAVLAGGDEAAIERARPVLQALGEVRTVGGREDAAALKLIANTMLAGTSALAAELMAAGAAAGLNAEDVFWAVARLAPYLAARKAGFIEHRYEPVMFALRDAAKDLRLASELYARTGATTPLTAKTRELYEKAAESAGDLDLAAISSVYENAPAKRP